MKSFLFLAAMVVWGTFTLRAGTLTDELDGKLVKYDGKKLEKVAKGSLADKKVIAFYYSAHWCPPCRALTPKLVEEYTALAKDYPNFELVFVSSDNSEKEMEEYMAWGKMPWPALDYDKASKVKEVEELSAAGIPYLVVVDADGKVLAGKGSKDWVHPSEIMVQLKEILKKG